MDHYSPSRYKKREQIKGGKNKGWCPSRGANPCGGEMAKKEGAEEGRYDMSAQKI